MLTTQPNSRIQLLPFTPLHVILLSIFISNISFHPVSFFSSISMTNVACYKGMQHPQVADRHGQELLRHHLSSHGHLQIVWC